MSSFMKPKYPQSVLFSTIIGYLTSYYIIHKLLDDVATQDSTAIYGVRIMTTIVWGMWLLGALYVGVMESGTPWYVNFAILVQLFVVLFHSILKLLMDPTT